MTPPATAGGAPDLRRAADPAGGSDPWFDRSSLALDPERLTGGATTLAYAVTLLAVASGTAHPAVFDVSACALTLQTVLLWLPWRLPRSRRSGTGFWVECCLGLIGSSTAWIAALAAGAAWLTSGCAWWWYAAGAAVGACLSILAGVRIDAVFSGEAAFLMGPTRRSHGVARAFCGLLGAPGEEALYRAPLLSPHGTGPAFGIVAASAFVGSHHAGAGRNGRGTPRSTFLEIAAAVLLMLVTVGSGSIYPALVAHLINNIPAVVVELQRDKTS